MTERGIKVVKSHDWKQSEGVTTQLQAGKSADGFHYMLSVKTAAWKLDGTWSPPFRRMEDAAFSGLAAEMREHGGTLNPYAILAPDAIAPSAAGDVVKGASSSAFHHEGPAMRDQFDRFKVSEAYAKRESSFVGRTVNDFLDGTKVVAGWLQTIRDPEARRDYIASVSAMRTGKGKSRDPYSAANPKTWKEVRFQDAPEAIAEASQATADRQTRSSFWQVPANSAVHNVAQQTRQRGMQQ